MKRPYWMPLLLLATTAGCANLTNVRTLGSGLKTVTDAVPAVVSQDEANCQDTNDVLGEYSTIYAQPVPPVDCKVLTETLNNLLVNNKALAAYGTALTNLAQDQYVTTDTDSKDVSGMLTSLGQSSKVASAISTVFGFIENAALQGYRQRHISQAMTGAPAEAFAAIANDTTALCAQYDHQLTTELSILAVIQNALTNPKGTDAHPAAEKSEPIAVAEMNHRLTGVAGDVSAKQVALESFCEAAGKLNPAFADAVTSLKRPSVTDLTTSIKDFASQAKAAHDAIVKAYPKI
jgi:hypothetical protein